MITVTVPTPCATDPALFDRALAESPEATRCAALCRDCPVLQACGRYVFTHRVGGYAAGFTEHQRKIVLAGQRESAA